MHTGCKHTAQRMHQGVLSFAATLRGIVPMDDQTAHATALYYLKHKLAKLDAVNGTMSVKHGMLLSPHAIASAMSLVKS